MNKLRVDKLFVDMDLHNMVIVLVDCSKECIVSKLDRALVKRMRQQALRIQLEQ